MNIVVFGAGGRVGNLVVVEALKRGHKVRAFVHSNPTFDKNSRTEVVKGDIYSSEDVVKAVKNMDAVVSALGSWGTPKKDILAQGMRNIIPAMQEQNVKKIVSLTGSDALAPSDTKKLLHTLRRSLLLIGAPKVLRDGESHIRLLADSDLDWSVVRSPIMNLRGNKNEFKLTDKRPKPWQTVNRESVALAMLDIAESNNSFKKASFIVRK
jgi:putative NADH-flavin reductase